MWLTARMTQAVIVGSIVLGAPTVVPSPALASTPGSDCPAGEGVEKECVSYPYRGTYGSEQECRAAGNDRCVPVTNSGGQYSGAKKETRRNEPKPEADDS